MILSISCWLSLFWIISASIILSYSQIKSTDLGKDKQTGNETNLSHSEKTNSSHKLNNKRTATILALFSGTKNDLGLNHRLGTQVLRLALTKARKLYQDELDDIKLEIINDDTDCDRLNVIPNRLAERIYRSRIETEWCLGDSNSSKSANEGSQDWCNEASSEGSILVREDTTMRAIRKTKSALEVRDVDAIIGPSCDFLVDLVGRMAAYWDTPLYSVASIGGSFSRKQVYKTLTRLSPSTEHLSSFLMKLLELFKWRHLAVVVDPSQIEMSISLENLEQAFSRTRSFASIERQLFHLAAHEIEPTNTKQQETLYSSSHCSDQARAALEGGRRIARVFLLLLPNEEGLIRRLLLCAHELNMNSGEFTFIALQLGLRSHSRGGNLTDRSRSQLTGSQGSSGATSVRRSDQLDWYSAEDEANNLAARQMFESLMIVSTELPLGDQFGYFVEQTLELVAQYQKDRNSSSTFDGASVGPVAVALHDSLILAVESIRRRRQLDSGWLGGQTGDFRSGEQLPAEQVGIQNRKDPARGLGWGERLTNRALLMAGGLHINQNGDQELDYILSDLEPELGIMRPVARYSRESRQVFMLPQSYIHWPRRVGSAGQLMDSDQPPPDEPECGFLNDAPVCQDRESLYLALVVLLTLCSVLVLIGSLSWRRFLQIKHQMKLDDLWWQVSWSDLQFVAASGLRSGAGSSLGSNARAVARAILSGAGASSMVSAGSDDGGSSFVSVNMEHLNKRKSTATATTTRSNEGSLKKATSRIKRRHALPELIISSSETVQTPEVTTNHPSESTATSAKKGNNSGGAVSGVKSNEKTRNANTGGSTVVSGSAATKFAPISEGTLAAAMIRSEYSTTALGSSLAILKGELVMVRRLNRSRPLEIKHELLVELNSIRELIHDNLAHFYGLCTEPNRWATIQEYCSRGSLKDLLLNHSIGIDSTLRCSIIGDIVSGLAFIHSTQIGCHGRLKSTNLVLDSRFTVKITDFGLSSLYNQLEAIPDCDEDRDEDEDEEEENNDNPTGSKIGSKQQKKRDRKSLDGELRSVFNMESVSFRDSGLATARSGGLRSDCLGLDRGQMRNAGPARYFWTSPEQLRERIPHSHSSKKADIYSFAIILAEIFTRRPPYYYGTSASPNWPQVERDQRRNQSLGVAGGGASGVSGPTSGASSSVGGSTNRLRAAKRRSRKIVPSGTEDGGNDAISLAGSERSTSSAVSVDIRTSGGRTKLPEISHLSAKSSKKRLLGGNDDDQDEDESDPIEAEQILDQIRMGIQPEPVRPYVPNHVLRALEQPGLVSLMNACWSEVAANRPSANQVRSQLKRATGGLSGRNYLDNLLDRLQDYAAKLEQIVEARSSDILVEKQRTENLLYQLLPKFVADRLKSDEPIVPEVFEGVTIFFSDIVGFEKYSSFMTPGELIDLLNSIYSSFDSIISSFDVTKIETIIDQFLVASGISLGRSIIAGNALAASEQPKENTLGGGGKSDADERRSSSKKRVAGKSIASPEVAQGQQTSSYPANSDQQLDQQDSQPTQYQRTSAEQVARMALCIRDLVKSTHFRQTLMKNSASSASPTQGSAFVAANLNIRCGIHSGRVCAGIVGLKRPKYCLIGDTVNVASRMHTNSKANKIQISADAKRLLDQVPGLSIEPRGLIEVKGKGSMETYWLESSY